jgi:hypothetical protein
MIAQYHYQYQVFPQQAPLSVKGPPIITFSDIKRMKSKHQLMILEKQYDSFLNRQQHTLILHDVIEHYLDIRDALIIQIQRIQREERMLQYQNNTYPMDSTDDHKFCGYTHEFQPLLPAPLKLNQLQILQGYMPCPNEPKEYKCGCLFMKYYSPCACVRPGPVCKNMNCNEKKYQTLKMHAYCRSHSRLKMSQTHLEARLTKISKELGDIRRNSNSLDYEDYQNTISKHPQPKRISRYPWKNN